MAAPLTTATRGLVDAEVLAAMKPSAGGARPVEPGERHHHPPHEPRYRRLPR
ncbi:hypothetical protein [Arthrobacter sp. NPDC093139]|uniref:hypothetical protein n=1 Tax=Arthrobacter sp. NPDC093139 TaxID=3363945 RepID=UPI0037F7FDD5